MILQDSHKRVICWGSSVGMTDIQVGLLYIDSSVSTPQVTLKDRKGNNYPVILPESFLYNPMPSKAQNVNLIRCLS